jgi:ATP-dependent exoDNAse (exonuclease V) alpha subunit
MADYHLSVKPVSRKGGRSATAAAAYRSGELIHDVTSDEVFDYTRKRGVEHTEIVLPTAAAQQDINWARDRAALWNAAEMAENRSNSRVAREYELALPHELTHAQRVELARAFSADIANRYGVAADFAIHAPHWGGDSRNHHAHVLTTTRKIEAGGLGEKSAIEWSDTNRRKAGLVAGDEEIFLIRQRWTTLANEHLQAHGIDARIDHRSLEAQGIEREPQSHLGPAVSAMQRRGMATEVVKRLEAEGIALAQERLEKAAELGRLEREKVIVERSILDLSGDLEGAKRERDLMLLRQSQLAQKPLDLEAVRAQARENWLAYRAEQAAKERAPAAEKSASLSPDHAPELARQKPLSIEEQQREARERWLEYRREQRRHPTPDQGRSVQAERDLDQGLERDLKRSKELDGPEIE